MIRYIIGCLLLFWIIGEANAQSQTAQQIAKLERAKKEIEQGINKLRLKKIKEDLGLVGLPHVPKKIPQELVEHSAMFLSYNEQHEQANWVAHVIIPKVNERNLPRPNDFRPDPKVSTKSATKQDYWDSGFDRGHLVPSADFRWSKKAMSETYFYSNMSPQRSVMNGRRWAELENALRKYVKKADEQLIVLTGPWLSDDLTKVPQGSKRLSIPRYFYKVVLDIEGDETKGIAFLMPNNHCHESLEDYAVSIDYIEEKTGINFFPKLADTLQHQLENTFDYTLWDPNAKRLNPKVFKHQPLAKEERPANTINTKVVHQYRDQEVTVCGTVASTYKTKQGKVYLNIDNSFPNQPLAIAISAEKVAAFSYAPEQQLKGKKICVKGLVKYYRGKPAVYVSKEEEIELLK